MGSGRWAQDGKLPTIIDDVVARASNLRDPDVNAADDMIRGRPLPLERLRLEPARPATSSRPTDMASAGRKTPGRGDQM